MRIIIKIRYASLIQCIGGSGSHCGTVQYNDLDTASSLFQHAKTKFGPDDLVYEVMVGTMMSCYFRAKQPAQAEALFEDLLDICRKRRTASAAPAGRDDVVEAHLDSFTGSDQSDGPHAAVDRRTASNVTSGDCLNRQKLAPSDVTFGSAIFNLVLAGRAEKAIEYFEKMQSEFGK